VGGAGDRRALRPAASVGCVYTAGEGCETLNQRCIEVVSKWDNRGHPAER
jgi:hypothetical protein